MANVILTASNDKYVQKLAEYEAGWYEMIALAGDDDITVFGQQVQPGPGNDRIERVPLPNGDWAWASVVYWGSPGGVRVDLVQGIAEDGWGGRDQLIHIDQVGGSSADDWFRGNDRDNFFWPTHGNDTIDGGAGNDGIRLPWIFGPTDGNAWREPSLADVSIRVSADGRHARVSAQGLEWTTFHYTLSDVEYLVYRDRQDGPELRIQFNQLITFSAMAEDAIAAGPAFRWNAASPLGTATPVTYSFVTTAPTSGPGATGFRAFSASEQQFVRDILAKTSAIAGLTFNEVADSSPCQIRFGVSQQTATKGVSWLPGQAGAGDNAGDVWMDVDSMIGIAPGTEGYQALLHEIGHALGLRHPRNTDPGESWAMQLREQDDRAALSVMSQAPSLSGLFHSDWALLDVLALQHLYGTRGLNGSESVYKLVAAHADHQTTIHDTAVRTLDASALGAGVRLSLKPGSLSDVGVNAEGQVVVENLALADGVRVEEAIGTAHDDVLIGNQADNRLTGGGGNDWIDGGTGTDTAVLPGPRSAWELSHEFGATLLTSRDGRSGYTTLMNIEQLQFSDGLLVLAASPLGRDVISSVDEDAVLGAALPTPGDISDRSQVAFALAGGAAHGTVTVSAGGDYRYTPTADFWGADSFHYRVSSDAGSNTYRVDVNVLPVNDGAPVAKNASLLVAGGAVLRAQLPAASDIDGDPISYAATADAQNGEVVVASDGSFSYQAKPGFSGSDTFSFIVGDGLGGTNVYSVSLDVMPVASVADGTEQADVRIGRALADAYRLLGGRDQVTAEGGNDLIDGGAGIDTAVYTAARAGYRVQQASFGWTVDHFGGGADGRDSLTAVERLHFADFAIALDLDGNAGQVAQILRGLFGKDYLKEKTYVGLGLLMLDSGVSYSEVIRQALGTQAFLNVAGNGSNEALVNVLYRNVFNKAPSVAEINTYAALITNGTFTREALVEIACRSGYIADSVELVGLVATGIEFLPQGG